MSDLLNKASLVMVPSGYKEDTVYSVVPTDGSGDLTFTRASNGTRVNSAGLVEVTPWNLLEYSEDFTNAFWNKYQSAITANAISAPNGTTTADKLEYTTTGTAVLFATSSALQNQVYTLSCYGKKGTTNIIQIGFTLSGGDKSANFNLNTGVITTTSSGVNASIESVGNGWYRCIMSLTTDINTPNIFINSTSGTTGEYIYIWGAQLNIGSTAKPYFPTTDRLNVPRLTYQNGGGGCPSLLLEKQSTNLVSYSNGFDNAAWNKNNVTITANSVTSPDGTQNANTITDNTTNGSHIAYQFGNQTVGTAWTCYMKKGSLNYGFIGAVQGTTVFTTAIINLNDGSIVELQNGSSTTGAVTTEDCGNGWYRVKMQTNANGAGYSVGTSNGSALSGTYKEAIYTGTGSGTIYIWGAQLEDSSYPTSYIPTTSSSATRVADACYQTGISSLIGQTEGVLYAEIYPQEFQNASYIGISDGSTSNRIIFGFESGAVNSGNLLTFGKVSFPSSFTATRDQKLKVAIGYKSGDSVLYINGTQIGTDTSTFTATFNQAGYNWQTTGQPFKGKSGGLYLFPTRLTNSELASLTTL